MLKEFLEKYQIEEEIFAVGVSGGADSLALVLMLQEELAPEGKKIVALTVNHCLREEAAAEAEYVAQVMQQHQIEHHVLVWEGEKPLTGIEESARIARYNLLKNWCEQNQIKSLFIAHHCLDQAETFLMRLQRGSGLDGLCGMSPFSRLDNLKLLRPLLATNPRELRAYLVAHDIKWVEDVSNQNEDYLRVKVRNFLPQLEQALGISPKRIADTMEVLQKTKACLQELTDKFIKSQIVYCENAGASFDLETFNKCSSEIRYRVLCSLLKEIGGKIYQPESEEVLRLIGHLQNQPFKGCTLAGCEFLHFQHKVWIVSEVKDKRILSKKDWKLFVEKNPIYKKLQLPYKLRLSLVKINPIYR